MSRNTAVITKPVTLKKTCMHYWVIESAKGPVSRGVCRRCGVKREFKNYPTECVIQHNAFRELSGEQEKDELEWQSFIEAEYTEETVAGDQQADVCERELDAVCAGA